jgi:capsular exopolysaccharide synthesis family protein
MDQLASRPPPRSFAAPAPAEFEWSRLWRALVRRRGLFAAVSASVFALVAVVTFLMPHVYTTHVKLIAGTSGSANVGAAANTTLPLLNALLDGTGVQSSETYAELFTEAPVASAVIASMPLAMTPGALLAHVKVRPVVNTTLLDVSVSWSNPQMSAAVANAFAAAFVDRERSLVATQADQALRTLDAQLPAAERDAARARSALTTFESKNDMADLQTQTQNTMNAYAALSAHISATQADERAASAQLASDGAQLGSIAASSPGGTSVAPNPVLATLQAQLAAASVQLQVAEQQYTDAHPAVIALRRQTAQLQREIRQTAPTVIAQSNSIPNPVYIQLSQQAAIARAQVASDDAVLAQLGTQLAAMKPQLAALPGKATRVLELQRRSRLADDVLGALAQKRNDANISKTTAIGDVTITSPARAEDATHTPNRVLNLAVGAVASVALGALVTLLVFVFDRRIRDARQIEEDLDLPVLASVPKLGDLRNRIASIHAPALPSGPPWLRAIAVESFLELVTALRYSTTSDRRLRSITVTSPMQGDGKSTIALNTAITMAHVQPRVLLIDGDLRRPSLHAKLNRELGRGLSDVLVGTAAIDEVITPTEYEGLDLLTSGTTTPNSVKLLQSERFDRLLAELEGRYQTVIIDAPALAPVVDAAILAAKSDGTILVVSIDSSDGVQMRRAVAKLQGVGVGNIVGTVANRVKPFRREIFEDYLSLDPAPNVPALT